LNTRSAAKATAATYCNKWFIGDSIEGMT
jgi:hypothetical protein